MNKDLISADFSGFTEPVQLKKLLQVVVGSAPARLEFHRTLGSRNRMIPLLTPITRYLGLVILYNLILLEYRFFSYFRVFTSPPVETIKLWKKTTVSLKL